MRPLSASADRERALALFSASRETLQRLDLYVELLGRWRRVTNLIGESTFSEIWTRHIADSAQLLALAPHARKWLDLGSGAGLPGLVIAIQLADVPGAEVHCVESDKRKCAFLREAARAASAPVVVQASRIEELRLEDFPPIDIVTSRALAPLGKLLELADPWLSRGAVGLFPKGRGWNREVQEADAESQFQIEPFRSSVDPDSQILRVSPRAQATR